VTIFKIRRKSDSHYSLGGRSTDVGATGWTKDGGKVWTELKNIKRHLRQFDLVPADWQIVEFDLTVKSRKQAMKLVKGKRL
jgi:hypothetical protein